MLMPAATIINSDMIPFKRRGLYQAAQNVVNGFGSICGASLGGPIADTIGWRWCFLLQVPVSLFAILMGYLVLKDTRTPAKADLSRAGDVWKKVDLLGSLLLVLGLSAQLAGLSLGGNELPWNHGVVIGCLVGSLVLLGAFILVEGTTTAIPIIPLRMLRGKTAVSAQLANVCVGIAAYSVRISNRACVKLLTTIVPLHVAAVFPSRALGLAS
jgi:MFS family permease